MAKINAESFHRFMTGELVDGDNSPTGKSMVYVTFECRVND
jgi:hypothetical protein